MVVGSLTALRAFWPTVASSALPAAAVESSSDVYVTVYLPILLFGDATASFAPFTIACDCGPEAPWRGRLE